jgi:hypothetical protein
MYAGWNATLPANFHLVGRRCDEMNGCRLQENLDVPDSVFESFFRFSSASFLT